MKSLWLPIGMLSLILVLSLSNGYAIGAYTERWTQQVYEVEAAATAGNWDEAERLLQALQDDWQGKQTYLHIVEVHELLNEAETALQCAIACIPYEDETEFLLETRELTAQFGFLAEAERLNLRNVL